MYDYAQLAALAAVHRRGSFDLAAADLGVTPSAVSQRIKALEEHTGTRLIRRGSPSAATDTGLRLVRHAEQVALLEHALSTDLPGSKQGTVRIRIAVNADSLATWVIPALAMVEGMLFDLVIEDQDVATDWLHRGEVAAAITAEPGPLQGCDTLPLGALRYRATASPAFVARWFAGGVTAEALRRAPVLQFSENDRLQDRWAERQTQGLLHRPALPSHRLGSSHGFVEACRVGIAWAMNPQALVAGDIAAGRLVDLNPALPLDVELHWQYARLTAPALAPLTRAMRAEARKALIQNRDVALTWAGACPDPA